MIYVQKIGGFIMLSGGEKSTISKYLEKIEYIKEQIQKRSPKISTEKAWELAIQMEKII